MSRESGGESESAESSPIMPCPPCLFDNHPCDMLSAERDHGHAPARIDTAADEEQVAELRALFRRFEGEIPASIADHAIDRAPIGGVTSLDVEWRPEIFNDDVAAQIGKSQAFELVEAEFFKRDVVFARIGVTIVDIRDMRQNLDVVAARRRL